VQDLQPHAVVEELGPGPVAGAVGVLGPGVGEGEGLIPPPTIVVEAEQVAGEVFSSAELFAGDGGVQQLPEQGFGLVGVEPGQGAGMAAADVKLILGAAGGLDRRGEHGQQRGGGRRAFVAVQDLFGGGGEFGPTVLAQQVGGGGTGRPQHQPPQLLLMFVLAGVPQVGQPDVAQVGVDRGRQVGCGGGAAGVGHPGMNPEPHHLAGVGVGLGGHQCLLHQRDQSSLQVGRVTGPVQALPQLRPDGVDD